MKPTPDTDVFEVDVLRSGQARAYQDTVKVFEITSNLPEDEVKSRCVTEVYSVDSARELAGYAHTGACGFPFGLKSFYTFIEVSEGKFRYTVTIPFCD